MTKPEVVKLEWEGPISIGKLPTDKKTVAKLKQNGIYIYTMSYPRVRKCIIYAGKSSNLLWRIQQHFGSYLGFIYGIRGENAKYKFKGEHDLRFDTLNNIDENLKFAIKEAKRMRIYYAIIHDDKRKFIKPIESVLIGVLKDKHGDEISIEGKKIVIECDNGRRENYGYDKPINIQLKCKNLESTGNAVFENLFGAGTLKGKP